MKPRQSLKNYHNNSAPDNTSVPHYAQPSSLSLPGAIRDLDLAKLGLNPYDLSNMQSNQSLQNIYGKTGTDVLRNLPLLPKSWLNLAACSSTTPNSSVSSSGQSASKFSSMVSQLNMRSAHNTSLNTTNQSNLNINGAFNAARPNVRATNASINNINDALNQKVSINNEHHQQQQQHTSMLKHMTKPTTSANNITLDSNCNVPSRSSLRHLQVSLLSEDQQTHNNRSNNNNNNIKQTACNATNSNVTQATSRVPAHIQISTALPSTSKEAYLATLQERAAKAGVSIGEINSSVHQAANNNTNNSILAQQNYTVSISPNQQLKKEVVDRNEIESALSRVEARNDLSLLYPPLLLASNSQRQINALSAELQGNEDSELFTEEVKRIVLEECNIIYECKECNNLFRSLANLVKHKRSFCPDHSSDRSNIETNKRQYLDTLLPTNQASKSQTSLSKLLQSQPKNRMPVSRDTNLISALNMTPRTSTSLQNSDCNSSTFDGDRRTSCSINEMTQDQLIRNSSLAKSLLTEKANRQTARQPNQRQSLLELSKVEQSVVSNTKGAVPKRKLLEDCIKKVKRDKLITGNDGDEVQNETEGTKLSAANQINNNVIDNQSSLLADNTDMHDVEISTMSNVSKVNSPHESDDSDMLMIDLDEPKRNSISDRKGERTTTASSAGPSSSSSFAKLNSSSALLKALTRPVDNKKPSAFTPVSTVEENNNSTTATTSTSLPTPQEPSVEEEVSMGDEECDNNRLQEELENTESEVKIEAPRQSPSPSSSSSSSVSTDSSSSSDSTSSSTDSSDSSSSGESDSDSDSDSSDSESSPSREIPDEEEEEREAAPSGVGIEEKEDCKDDNQMVVVDPVKLEAQSQSSAANTSSSSASTSSANSNSAGTSGGGIMKLKIQLKTKSDEKSKVYEIV